MGVCESKTKLHKHSVRKLSQNSTSETIKLKFTPRTKTIHYNQLIDNAKNTIDETNDKIDTLQERYKEYESQNENLKKELRLLKMQQKEKDEITEQCKHQLNVQREIILEREAKMQFISEGIQHVNQQRKHIDSEYKNYLVSISDTLYKIHGSNTSKLKYNKASKKVVTFIAKINHLFYYNSDEQCLKNIIVRDILTNNNSIQRKMNKPWFLVVGDKRSALFAVDEVSIRDKWINVITQSLNKQNNFDEPLQNGLNDKLSTNNDTNEINNATEQQCGPSSIVIIYEES